MILAPVMFFTVLEIGLRLGGYGYPTAFLIGPDAKGIYTSNPQFGWRFFPRAIARKPVPCFISAKPADTIRIFILGSSAAQGIPDPSFSFGRILEVLLRERYPQVKFEVVNAAMTAINSHITLDIARDCAAHQPDLFVVYMGNNEVVGPYGPGSVFQHWSPSLKFIRANVWLKSLCIGQLLDNAMGRLSSRDDSLKSWRGMEMFTSNTVAADDPRLASVYDNYRQNLVDLCGVGQRAGARVILSTVAVNLMDCPPLASQHRSDLSPEKLAEWKSIYDSGVELETQRQWSAAIAKYDAAMQIDDRFAELPFRLGRCLAALDRHAEARERFIAARDLDVLRFRADSKINAIVREVAAEQKSAGVRLADVEQSLAKSDLAVGGILGAGLFYEHVHFNFDGNYLLARSVLEQIDDAMPQLAASRSKTPVISKKQCRELLALTPWNEFQMAEQITEMMSRPPFTNQLDHADRQASAKAEAESLGNFAAMPVTIQAACATYEAALEKAPDDWDLHYRYGTLAIKSGLPQIAVEQFRLVLKKLTSDPQVYINLGYAEQSCGRIDEAILLFQKALDLDPQSALAHINLGNALSGLGRTDEAFTHFQQALDISPSNSMAHNNIGAVLLSRGKVEGAIIHFKKALEIDPSNANAQDNLDKAQKTGSHQSTRTSH
jgi:tetratricopeptide (TPR) repeat protein